MSTSVDLSHVRAQVEILKYVKAQQAKLKELEKEARSVIEEALGGHETGKLDGSTVVTWKFGKANRLNQGLLKQKYPEVAAECTQLNQTRTFTVS